jgi:hypothetical protein
MSLTAREAKQALDKEYFVRISQDIITEYEVKLWLEKAK